MIRSGRAIANSRERPKQRAWRVAGLRGCRLIGDGRLISTHHDLWLLGRNPLSFWGERALPVEEARPPPVLET